MAETTNIEWADSTLNIWEGCQETGSPACVGCYARARKLRYAPKGTTEAPNWGPRAPRREVKSWPATLRKISRLAAAAFTAGRTEPWFVFVNSLSDFWDNQADPAWRAAALTEFAKHPHLTFLLLTKRPQNILKMWTHIIWRAHVDGAEPEGLQPTDEQLLAHFEWPKNVAIGCTVVTQAEADRDVPHLLHAKAILNPAFAFLSMEPLVEMVDLTRLSLGKAKIDAVVPEWEGIEQVHFILNALTGAPKTGIPAIDWVIAGGMTSQGKHPAVPVNPDVFVDVQIQCEDTSTPFLFKQWGDWIPDTPKKISQMEGDPKWQRVGVHWMHKVGAKAAGRTLLGKIHDVRPEVRA